MGRMRWPLIAAALVCAMAASAAGMVGASDTTDQSLLQIEQVASRLSGTPAAVENVAKAVADRGISATSDAQPLLETAARSSFKADSMFAEISKAVGEAGDDAVDPKAFAKVAAALEAGQAKIARMYEAQDQTAAKDIEMRLANPDNGPRISQLADLMAGPDLAVDTAFTAQLMYLCLEALSNSDVETLASASKDKLQSEMQGVISSLRSKSENEKPVPKDIARANEKTRLTFVLATLSPEDVSVLTDFYESPGGKAKRDALIESYRQASDQANTEMLGQYFQALADYLKTHPRPQQQQ
ncbi:hypothetical protein ELI13_35030 [Rhizobium ruizarguesonis]|uniref:DUF2059 domain-containing protein n=2 Tax=Rhizobium ruizarguesonis TaxID=2081791 RepID=A0ABY1WWV8_9HYPH|nr:hypothetical protein ELI48_20440 [Rhizobium ruizarguesonis]TAU60966.1 hypothetical protein ELI46_33500 [Rhizobium ruizarguesonis]TAU71502.1 hypothetical protein ELI45_22805 [Rhizobium ruizarguesonis]TAV02271.1 hypothetical protein ELI34_35725 [Rhizobium ruizarguesonis]TAV19806.1 hypothetical protein ELI36_35685 [Rhizobium ruizarguesonis]